jgi:integrase
MGLGSNLCRRGDGLLFRRRVPKRAERFFRSRFLSLPLQTHLLREGRRMAAHATRFTDAAFTLVVACGGPMLDAQDIERVVVDLMRFELEAREAARAVAPARAPAEIEAALRIEAATRQTLVAAIAHNDYAAVAQPVNAALARLGVAVAEDAPDWRMAARRAAIGLVAVCEENARREQGVYGDGAQLLALALAPTPLAASASPMAGFAIAAIGTAPVAHGHCSGAAPAAPIAWASGASASALSMRPAAPETGALDAPNPNGAPNRAVPQARPPAADVAEAKTRGRRPQASVERTQGFAYRPVPTPNPAAPNGARKFFELGMAYLARRSADSKSWAENSAPQVKSALRAFQAIEGDLTCDECYETRFAEFFDTYRRLPANWGKGGRTPIEDIDHADAQDAALADEIDAMRKAGARQGDIDTRSADGRAKRVKAGTLYRVMQDLQRIVVDEGLEHGFFARNVMRKVIWSKKKLEEVKKDEADTPRLPWGDRAKDLFATSIFTQPLSDIGDPMYWLPLMGYLDGVRMEEGAQLATRDFDTMNGVPIIRIRQGEGQHLKNLSARRNLPIHESLIELGLMRLVEKRRQEGEQWLFPDLARGAARGRKSEVFSGLFTEYRREEGVYDPQRDFHSLRKDFNVNMKRMEVGLEIRKRLMGHRLVDVTETHYDPEGSPIEKFRDAVNLIKLDISGIRRPFGDGGNRAPKGPNLRLVS